MFIIYSIFSLLIYSMSEWCTIESDPGVFTELIRNVGVKGIQVEEVITLDEVGYEDRTIYGLIFLFKYVTNSQYKPNVLKEFDEELYFPKQVITNACATQAIISILLNNEDKIELGSELSDLKAFTKEMDPYMKGLSISNSEKIRMEHNKFSKPEPFVYTSSVATEKDDVFHFVSYLHFKNNVYEIDGLQEGPILICENVQNEEWIDKVKPSIIERINLYSQNEIKFNLLSIVPDRRNNAQKEEENLQKRKHYIMQKLTGSSSQVENASGDVEMGESYSEYDNKSPEELNNFLQDIENNLVNFKMIINAENEKMEKYRIENERRQHNYIPLIFEMLKMLSEKGVLESIVDDLKQEEENKVKENNI